MHGDTQIYPANAPLAPKTVFGPRPASSSTTSSVKLPGSFAGKTRVGTPPKSISGAGAGSLKQNPPSPAVSTRSLSPVVPRLVSPIVSTAMGRPVSPIVGKRSPVVLTTKLASPVVPAPTAEPSTSNVVALIPMQSPTLPTPPPTISPPGPTPVDKKNGPRHDPCFPSSHPMYMQLDARQSWGDGGVQGVWDEAACAMVWC
ncbi:hypothetical protein BDV93DRAFT_49052 [Ceratobasidium sp. AG-I]|nr:hypothetical protein BDV93DRAFT_49052 [Ceratobasidium sp. AG-I]